MTFCEVFVSVIVGLVTGALSGWGVSKFFQKKEDKRAYERYKRELSQFLYQLYDELIFIERGGDCRALVEKLGRPPYDEWASNHAKGDCALIKEVLELIDDLRIFGFSQSAGSRENLENNGELSKWQNRIPSLAKCVLEMEYPPNKLKRITEKFKEFVIAAFKKIKEKHHV